LRCPLTDITPTSKDHPMNHHRPSIANTPSVRPFRFFRHLPHRRRTTGMFALFVALALLLAAPTLVHAQPQPPAPTLHQPAPAPSPTPVPRNGDAGVIRGILPVAGRTTGHFLSHTSTGGATMTTTTIERRLTPWFDALNLAIKRIDERPDHPSGEVVYVLKDVFTTRDGSWEPSELPFAAPDWARAAYLDPGVFTKAFERTNLYAAVLDEADNFIHGHPILSWSDGFERLGDASYDGFVRQNAWETPGWSTMVMYSSSSYAPGSGQTGPWCWMPADVAAEVVCGGGLPDGEAVSIFAVWQAMRADDVTPEPTPDPTPEPTPDPTPEPTPDPTPEPTPDPTPEPQIVVERRLGRWFEAMNFQIRTIAERPDQPVQGDYIYVIKDVFTTLNGSWENMGDELGTVEAWARDAYLKPFHAPDYFDDAGADHHLFSAVIGLDGQFVRNFPMRYWSDGFAMLGDPEYQSYAYHLTKERSGWANLVMLSGSSYAPNRGGKRPLVLDAGRKRGRGHVWRRHAVEPPHLHFRGLADGPAPARADARTDAAAGRVQCLLALRARRRPGGARPGHASSGRTAAQRRQPVLAGGHPRRGPHPDRQPTPGGLAAGRLCPAGGARHAHHRRLHAVRPYHPGLSKRHCAGARRRTDDGKPYCVGMRSDGRRRAGLAIVPASPARPRCGCRWAKCGPNH
jgi:hypothetical protein